MAIKPARSMKNTVIEDLLFARNSVKFMRYEKYQDCEGGKRERDINSD